MEKSSFASIFSKIFMGKRTKKTMTLKSVEFWDGF